ncbi:hypothetical protein DICPUDRAFT_36659 [Dictyostelium purpureum]|uniref:Uncharacterized protein n=1 Tax=Dictyostelium purpureum TaxID=5786 RepID=F0ZRG3_DICPU|nr:uncharacterized protein DICPUDRAFT_36659 [Dictyostelium purpureum]EGC33476.1 hypothetical protein DICPUDRAFT_36659 [Dictyostelium purpureum]|eukprot:XP_003289999.1 hypothetical protein DICPUDRAFT_36659 [Dictyostelium purpureum]
MVVGSLLLFIGFPYIVLKSVLSVLFTFLTVYYIVDQFLLPKLREKPLSSYKGKVVIITGASGGIGEECAKQYARLGSKVVLVARRTEQLNRVKENILKNYSRVKDEDLLVVKADLTIQDDCKQMVQTVIDNYSKIDICVWNAGLGSLIEFSKLGDDIQIYRDNMEINYFSLVYCTHLVFPYLIQSKGSIVVISSLAGKFGTALRTSYSASKHAVQGFFNSLRHETKDIQITIVNPGFILTEFHDNLKTLDGNKVERNKGNFMTAERCAAEILEAERQRRRELIQSAKGKFGVIVQNIAPDLVDFLSHKFASSSVKK